jgi:hypothetical protein
MLFDEWEKGTAVRVRTANGLMGLQVSSGYKMAQVCGRLIAGGNSVRLLAAIMFNTGEDGGSLTALAPQPNQLTWTGSRRFRCGIAQRAEAH